MMGQLFFLGKMGHRTKFSKGTHNLYFKKMPSYEVFKNNHYFLKILKHDIAWRNHEPIFFKILNNRESINHLLFPSTLFSMEIHNHSPEPLREWKRQQRSRNIENDADVGQLDIG